jgi:hypothetical protein
VEEKSAVESVGFPTLEAEMGALGINGLAGEGETKTPSRATGKRVLVCGGRDYDDQDHIWNTLVAIDLESRIDVVIHGCATGADTAGVVWAQKTGRKHAPFQADWREHGKAAGPMRNQRMIDQGKPDLVVAFPGGRGTADMVRRAEAAGIEVRRIAPKGMPNFEAEIARLQGGVA